MKTVVVIAGKDAHIEESKDKVWTFGTYRAQREALLRQEFGSDVRIVHVAPDGEGSVSQERTWTRAGRTYTGPCHELTDNRIAQIGREIGGDGGGADASPLDIEFRIYLHGNTGSTNFGLPDTGEVQGYFSVFAAAKLIDGVSRQLTRDGRPHRMDIHSRSCRFADDPLAKGDTTFPLVPCAASFAEIERGGSSMGQLLGALTPDVKEKLGWVKGSRVVNLSSTASLEHYAWSQTVATHEKPAPTGLDAAQTLQHWGAIYNVGAGLFQ